VSIRAFRGDPWFASAPTTGNAGSLVYRLQNMLKRGLGTESYYESAIGPLSLSQTIATGNLTGTLAINSTTTVTGTGTAFLSELRPGMMVFVVNSGTNASYLLGVDRIVSDTSFIAFRSPGVTLSGLTGVILPVCYAVDTVLGSSLAGNAVKTDKGTLFSVGAGTLRLDGSAISASLTLSRSPKVSIYNSGAGTYTNFTLGLPIPTGQTATNIAGGTKGMVAGNYSLRITAERDEYVSYGNPGARLDVTLTAGDKIQIDFGAFDVTSGQNAWGVWATPFSATVGSTQNVVNGPWYRVRQFVAADLTAHVGTLEYLDAEIEGNPLLTFDNDAPPKALFVALFNGIPVWISCAGPGDICPGPFIFPAKPSNIEAAPPALNGIEQLAYPTSPPETIIGCVSAVGRIFLLTTNHLQVALGTASGQVPVRIQPFWKSGFKNPYQLVFVDDVLYGETTAGPARSIGEGDEQEVQQNWAAGIEVFWRRWVTGHVLVEHDPSNDAVCYFESANALNSSGFWTTRVWMWGLTAQDWIGEVLLTSTTGDMIVSGVARVGNYLNVLCGGRQSDNSVSVQTYRFEGGSGASVPWYLALVFSDSGEELRAKRIGYPMVTGKLTSPVIKLYGYGAGETVDVSALEDGTGSKASATLATSTTVTEYARARIIAKNVKNHTFRLNGTYSGSGTPDTIQEVVYETSEYGARR
jgi:hypothetical protein